MGEAGLPVCNVLQVSWKIWEVEQIKCIPGIRTMAQCVLAVQAEESELGFTDPQNVSSVAVHTCNRSAGGIEQADLELHWPTKLKQWPPGLVRDPISTKNVLSEDIWTKPGSTPTCTGKYTLDTHSHYTNKSALISILYQWGKWLLRKVRNLAGGDGPSSSTNCCSRDEGEKIPFVLTLLRVKNTLTYLLLYTIVIMFYSCVIAFTLLLYPNL